MQDYLFKLMDDDTYGIISYEGDESEIVIPDTYMAKPVTILYDDLFKGHKEITSVRIPDTVKSICSFVFDGCSELSQIKLPAGLEDILQYAFVRSGIEEIELPDTVKSIVPYTFKDCKKLKKIVCGPSLPKIGAWAFDGCDALSELEVSDDTEISPRVFGDVDKFLKIAEIRRKR